MEPQATPGGTEAVEEKTAVAVAADAAEPERATPPPIFEEPNDELDIPAFMRKGGL